MSSTAEVVPAAVPDITENYDELDLDVIRGASRTLKIRGKQYPVPASLTIPMMAELLDLETSIRTTGIEPDPPAPDAPERVRLAYEDRIAETRRAAVGAINKAHEAIEDLIRIETPGVALQFDVNEVMLIIRWLVRNPQGASGAVVAAVSDAGGTGTPATDEAPEGEALPPGEAADAAPLPSPKRSSKRSSGSELSTA